MRDRKIENLIIGSLKELMEVLDGKIIGPLDSNARIFGRKGFLDSMGLVALITDLEEKIEEEFGVPLILADELAISQKKSPFRTVSSLGQFIGMLLEKEEQNERA